MSSQVKAREIPTPSNWHWAITPQQVTEIKQGNRDTINKVYFDNLPKFRKVFYGLCIKRYSMNFYYDCLQQVYCDLPNYDYTNARKFFHCLIHTYRIACGWTRKSVNLRNLVSYDKPLNGVDEDFTMLNVLADETPYNEINEAEAIEEDKRIVEIIETQPQLTEAQRDYLVAIAYSLALRRGLYADLQASIAV